MPDWSPDGLRVAFIATADVVSDIWVMDADGGNRTRLTTEGFVDRAPDWSPDGSLIAFERAWGEIWTIKPDGTDLTFIRVGRGPDWSPDGTQILFYSDEVYVMDADGSNAVALTVSGPSLWPVWSPDGSRIAYQTGQDLNPHNQAYEIYIMNADGTNPVRLTNNPATDRYPSWSPDGDTIVFTSYRDGHAQLYVTDTTGSGDNSVPLISNQSNNLEPAWSSVIDP